MRNLLLVPVGVCLWMGLAPPVSAAVEPRSGTILFRDGTILSFVEAVEVDGEPVEHTVKGHLGKLPVEYRYQHFDMIRFHHGDGMGEYLGTCQVLSRLTGESVLLCTRGFQRIRTERSHPSGSRNQNSGFGYFHFDTYDPVLGEMSRRNVPIREVYAIVYDEADLMLNPQNHMLYPATYGFDPYDGTKLEPLSP